jgi:hypothetical protein
MRQTSAAPAERSAHAGSAARPGSPSVPTAPALPESGVSLRLFMRLPRTDAAAVGVVRRLLDAALAEIEVNHRCRGEIADTGIGLDLDGVPDLDHVTARLPEPTAERGRGFYVMRAARTGCSCSRFVLTA